MVSKRAAKDDWKLMWKSWEKSRKLPPSLSAASTNQRPEKFSADLDAFGGAVYYSSAFAPLDPQFSMKLCTYEEATIFLVWNNYDRAIFLSNFPHFGLHSIHSLHFYKMCKMIILHECAMQCLSNTFSKRGFPTLKWVAFFVMCNFSDLINQNSNGQ